jgi:hypothetical protein|tara:strand:+ start:2296 stop:2664 length:369 start_codon:yes stop_codon:yes gene_type:complete
VIEITPAQLHINLLEALSAGVLPSRTVGEPGSQGELVAGMQGMGVSTPRAAAVAAATIGLAGDVHTPKGRTLTKGMWSMIVAAGIFEVITILVGRTANDEGTMPKEHCIIAPIHTCWPILCS